MLVALVCAVVALLFCLIELVHTKSVLRAERDYRGQLRRQLDAAQRRAEVPWPKNTRIPLAPVVVDTFDPDRTEDAGEPTIYDERVQPDPDRRTAHSVMNFRVLK